MMHVVLVALLGEVPGAPFARALRERRSVAAPLVHERTWIERTRGRSVESRETPASGARAPRRHEEHERHGSVLWASVAPAAATWSTATRCPGGIGGSGIPVPSPGSSYGYSVLAWTAAGTGAPMTVSSPVDEHVVVDVDGPATSQLHLADVLQGTRPRSDDVAERTVTGLVRAHGGCLLAAVPRLSGGWTVAGPGAGVHHVPTEWHPREPSVQSAAAPVPAPGTATRDEADTPSRAATALPAPSREPPGWQRQFLLPSCLHGWLVAGHSLDELDSARIVLHC